MEGLWSTRTHLELVWKVSVQKEIRALAPGQPQAAAQNKLWRVSPMQLWHTVFEDNKIGQQPQRVIGELLAAAFQEVLPSIESVPPIRFNTTACDAAGGKLQTQQWRLLELSLENLQHATIFGGDGSGQFGVCRPRAPRQGIRAQLAFLEAHPERKVCVMLPITVPLLRKVATVLVFDYLLWNYNRFRNYKVKRAPTLHYTRNTFVRLSSTGAPPSLAAFSPADIASPSAPFAFIGA